MINLPLSSVHNYQKLIELIERVYKSSHLSNSCSKIESTSLTKETKTLISYQKTTLLSVFEQTTVHLHLLLHLYRLVHLQNMKNLLSKFTFSITLYLQGFWCGRNPLIEHISFLCSKCN